MSLLPLYALRRRFLELSSFGFHRHNRSTPLAAGSLLECNTAELGHFIWRGLLPLVGTSPFPPHELMLMGAAMSSLRPELVVEWGTNIGVSALVFHKLNVHYQIGAEIHSIDLPDDVHHAEHPHRWRGILVRGLPVVLHQGDGPIIAADLIRERQPRSLLVFIDGDHSRESVIRDANLVLRAAPDAALLFHDTFFQPGSGYNHGPREAVQCILDALGEGVQVVGADLGCPGMTLVLPSNNVARSLQT